MFSVLLTRTLILGVMSHQVKSLTSLRLPCCKEASHMERLSAPVVVLDFELLLLRHQTRECMSHQMILVLILVSSHLPAFKSPQLWPEHHDTETSLLCCVISVLLTHRTHEHNKMILPFPLSLGWLVI